MHLLFPSKLFFTVRKKTHTSRTRHKTHTSLTPDLTADCVGVDGEIRTIRARCMPLHWTTLALEELIIHRSTISSFISLAFSEQTIMYFFPPTNPVTPQFFSCTQQRCLKNIRISRAEQSSGAPLDGTRSRLTKRSALLRAMPSRLSHAHRLGHRAPLREACSSVPPPAP